MSIVILDKSTCSICNKVLQNEEPIFLFSAFVMDTADPLYFFNDSAFHIECLNKHPLGKKAIGFQNSYLSKGKPMNQICSIGQNKIKNPDDFVFTGLLTSNENEELYKYNFAAFDRSNIPKWRDRDKFVKEIIKLKAATSNAGLDYLLTIFNDKS